MKYFCGSTQKRPHHGRSKKLSARAQRHIQRLCLGNRRMSAASIAAEVEGVGGRPVSAQTIRRTLHQIGLYGCHPRRKPLLKTWFSCHPIKRGFRTAWICWRITLRLGPWQSTPKKLQSWSSRNAPDLRDHHTHIHYHTEPLKPQKHTLTSA